MLWEGWPINERPDNRHTAATRMRLLSPEDRDQAIRHASKFRDMMKRRGKPAHMLPYLRERKFLQFEFGPDIDAQGMFIIKPDRPEWGPWLGNIRSRFGERGVQSIVRNKCYYAETRWPPEHRDEVAA